MVVIMKKIYELRWCKIPSNKTTTFDWKLWKRYATLDDMNVAIKQLIHLPKHRTKVFASFKIDTDKESIGFHFNMNLNPPPKK